jgi:hypothetical protein
MRNMMRKKVRKKIKREKMKKKMKESNLSLDFESQHQSSGRAGDSLRRRNQYLLISFALSGC